MEDKKLMDAEVVETKEEKVGLMTKIKSVMTKENAKKAGKVALAVGGAIATGIGGYILGVKDKLDDEDYYDVEVDQEPVSDEE